MRRLLCLWCAVSAMGCEPAPLLVSLVDAGAQPAAAAPSSGSSGASTGGAVTLAGATSGGASSSAASSGASSTADASSSAGSSSRPPATSGPLEGELAFPVGIQAGFFRVNGSGMAWEYRVWMADVAGQCEAVVNMRGNFALNVTVGTLEEGAAVTPGTYAVVPPGETPPRNGPYASVWGWWNPPSQLSFLAVAGNVQVTHASPNHLAGTLDVLMDRRDGSPATALRGAFDTVCMLQQP